MKKRSTKFMFMAASIVALSFGAFGQDESMEEGNSGDGYNHATFDVDFGFNRAFAKFTPGYSPKFIGFGHIGLGASYWPNARFGVKGYLGNERFKNPSEASKNLYSTNLTRISFLGLINLGRICQFEDWTQTIGLFMHAGPGFAFMSGRTLTDQPTREFMGVLQLGFTPYFKINDKLSITTDLTLLGNVRQGKTFDMHSLTGIGGFSGYFMTMTAGVSYNFGKGTKNILWKEEGAELEARIDALEAEIENMKTRMDGVDEDINGIEENMEDEDNDGVANYLDVEPGTPEGAVVNTKGEEVIMPDVDDLMDGEAEGLFFTVQLGVFSKMIPEKYWRNISPMYSLKIEDGSNRYFSGIYHNVGEATEKLNEAKEKGIKDAFITAYYKGQRITVAEAELILSTNGPEILRPKE